MSFRLRTLALLALAALAAALTALPTSAATLKLQGIGPDFSIHLKQGGKNVSRLRAGTYLLVVGDRSAIHNFHLSGPGLNKVVTSVAFAGTKTLKVTLKKGTYSFVRSSPRVDARLVEGDLR